ncbi:EAL domain-containing protein [Tepidamorphus sp. 3E244]|uniref:EAL domain-containing protein n=1 Tax=Tepidamorphus sp. 3E244 TaxID=3385498 RepID=UPI0038FCE63F
MARFMPWLVAMSIVVIAASLSAVLYTSAGLGMVEAAWIGVGVFLVLVVVQLMATRSKDASTLTNRIDDIGGASGKVLREIESLSLRIADLEVAMAHRIDDTLQERLTPVVEELSRVSDQLTMVSVTQRTPADIAADTADAVDRDIAEATRPVVDKSKAKAPTRSAAFAGTSDEEMKSLVREAVEAGRIEVHLQPIVTLPQRKVRYYEALARLRTDDGDLMLTEDYLATARLLNLMPAIDFTVFVRSVQVVRRLSGKNREVGLFLNVSQTTLHDERFSTRYAEFAEHNKALAGSIIFEFTQKEFDTMGPVEQATLEQLAELGFRFSVDHVQRLAIDGRGLSERRVRFVKADSGLLLQANGGYASDIHPADLSDLLARSGIDLIACRIERESEVVDLIDYDVRYAQGNLFSPPRPVKADVMQERTPMQAAQ